MSAVRWVRRANYPRFGVAHALVDGAVCLWARGQVCEQPWADVELTPIGRPFGSVCPLCLRRVAGAERRLASAVEQACASMDRRALWVRAGEGRRS